MSLVFSPEVPDADRRLIMRLPSGQRADPGMFRQAPPTPRRRRLWRADQRQLNTATVILAASGYCCATHPLAGDQLHVLLWLPVVVSASALAAAMPLWRRYDLEYRGLQAAHRWRDHIVSTTGLSQDAAQLLSRFETAAAAIGASTAGAAGLFDDIASVVELKAQRWAITRKLATISALSSDEPAFNGDEVAAERLRDQRAALKAAMRDVERRVTAVEDYATKVAQLDRLLAEQDLHARLDARDEQLLDLVADGARDALAAEQLDHMATGTAAVREAIAANLAEVREYGLRLRQVHSSDNHRYTTTGGDLHVQAAWSQQDPEVKA